MKRLGWTRILAAVLTLAALGCASTSRQRLDARRPAKAEPAKLETVRIPENVQRPDPSAAPALEQVEQRIVERANAFRAQQGLGPLESEPRLEEGAEQFAAYMARTNRYGHTADGRQPEQRAKAAGYAPCIVLENIAYQFSSTGFTAEALAKGFVEGWIGSPGHRENLVNPDVVHTGVGVARSADGTYYAVQKFGRPESMQLSFTVSNESGQLARYRVDGEPFQLPSRTMRTHMMCRAPEVRMEFSRDVLRPRDGARYSIQSGPRGGLRLKRE